VLYIDWSQLCPACPSTTLAILSEVTDEAYIAPIAFNAIFLPPAFLIEIKAP